MRGVCETSDFVLMMLTQVIRKYYVSTIIDVLSCSQWLLYDLEEHRYVCF